MVKLKNVKNNFRRKIHTKEQNIIRTMLWTSKDYKETELLSRHGCKHSVVSLPHFRILVVFRSLIPHFTSAN